MIISGCKKIVGGRARGKALVSRQPINFLAMVDAKAGVVNDPKHELYNLPFKGKVLVFPNAIGSSVGAYVFYSLKENGNAPSAIICSKSDITTASGAAIVNIPVVDLPADQPQSKIKQDSDIEVDADLGKIIITV